MTLINGQTVPDGSVTFNPANYTFTFRNVDGQLYDVTELVYRADKKKFKGYDQDVDNIRIYNMNYAAGHGTAAPVLNTDTAALFMTNVSNSVKPVIFTTTTIALLAGAAYLYFVVLKPNRSK